MGFLSILVKPVSGLCNIDCKYCFYKELNNGTGGKRCMSPEVTHGLIDRALASGAGKILFAFQGGEPLLAGEDYYEEFITYVNSRPSSARISYSIQTNGTLLTDRYIEIFKRWNFLVGISLDGPKYIQDKYRLTYKNEGTFERVIQNAQRLMKSGVPVNILTVVTKYSALRAGKMYQFYKKAGFTFIQFIPCMDSISEIQGKSEDSLDARSYYIFLRDLFTCWYQDLMQGEYISVRHFDNWVRLMMGQPVDTCSLSGKCGTYFVVERDGSVYPCDFYSEASHLLGNIVEDDFPALLSRLKGSGFLSESVAHRSEECKVCQNRDLCRGGCKRDWIWEGEQGRTRYCKALNRFFTEHRSKLAQIAKLVQGNCL